MTARALQSEIRNLKSGIRNRPGRLTGFTIIEILLAIGILAIGITAVLSLFAMGVRSHQRALDRTRVALLAEAVTNGLQANFPAGDPPVQMLDATHPDFPGFTYTVTFTLVGRPQDRYNCYRVSILVRWGDPAAPADPKNSETYETVLQRKPL